MTHTCTPRTFTITQRNENLCLHKTLHIIVHNTFFFAIAANQKQPKCPRIPQNAITHQQKELDKQLE